MSKTKAELEAGIGDVAVFIAEYDADNDMPIPHFTFNDVKGAIMAGRVPFVKFSMASATNYGFVIEPIMSASLNSGTYQIATNNLTLKADSPDVFMEVVIG